MIKAVVLLYCLIKIVKIMSIYQQAHYTVKPYVKHFFWNFSMYNIMPLFVICIGIMSNNLAIEIISCVMLVFYGAICFIPTKVKVNWTHRLLRLLALCIVVAIYLFWVLEFTYFIGIVVLFEFIVIPIMLLMNLFESFLAKKYIKKARKKLSSIEVNKIAITGSFGKTSTKLFLETLLSNYESTIATPKSYNTILGVTRFINESPLEAFSNVIFEFGATKKNDISKLVEYIKPSVGIITEIGPMHLDSFGSVESIVKEKMKLIESLDENGIGILNYESLQIRNYFLKTKAKIYTYGLNHGLVRAINIKPNLEFDLVINDEMICHLCPKFYGAHNILNILAGITYLYAKGFDLECLPNIISFLKNYDNRLEIKDDGKHQIINDGFSSNIKGLKSAVDLLLSDERESFIITPGIVEMGKLKQKIRNDVYNELKRVDNIILVGVNNSKYLYKKLKEINKKVYVVSDFKMAYSFYLKIRENSSALLIENDLPDLYRRGLDW